MNSVVYVGMDVDKEKAVIAVLRGTETEISGESVIRNERSAVRKFFSKLNGCGKVIACYEAGCFGFELYRQLTEMGVACMVVAPGLIPHRPSDRVKTDRRDGVPRRPPFLWVRDPPWQLPVQPRSEECMWWG
jgi:transposase